MLQTNLFSERTDAAAKMAPIESVPTSELLHPTHGATDSMDLKTVDMPLPTSDAPATAETAPVLPRIDITPAEITSSVQPIEADKSAEVATVEADAAVDHDKLNATQHEPVQTRAQPIAQPAQASPSPAVDSASEESSKANVQSIVTPLTSTASAHSGLVYLTDFRRMAKADVQELIRELRLLRKKESGAATAQSDASATAATDVPATSPEQTKPGRSKTLRNMITAPVRNRNSKELATDGNAADKIPETGSKKRPHGLQKRRSSSLKRMSSVFGDWHVTNIRQASANAENSAVDGQEESEGLACDVPAARTGGPIVGGGVGLSTVAEVDPPPSAQELEELYAMDVLDRVREKVNFGTLVNDASYDRVVVVFIRHFFCGNCFGYVRALTNEMPISRLDSYTPSTKLIVIGCGDPVLVPNYVKMTGCEFEIYADPSRSLYKKIGFSVNTLPLDPDNVPKYVSRWSPQTFVQNLLISLGLAVRSKSVNAGKISQNGGEMVWTKGQLEYTHRMKHPADHIEIEELERILTVR